MAHAVGGATAHLYGDRLWLAGTNLPGRRHHSTSSIDRPALGTTSSTTRSRTAPIPVVINLLGLGLGPFIAGLVSDGLVVGSRGLSTALSMVCASAAGLGVVAALFLRAPIGAAAKRRSFTER